MIAGPAEYNVDRLAQHLRRAPIEKPSALTPGHFASLDDSGRDGVGLDLLSPWLISYVSPVFVLTMLTGDILMTISFLVMMAIPLYEMWFLKQPLIFKRSNE